MLTKIIVSVLVLLVVGALLTYYVGYDQGFERVVPTVSPRGPVPTVEVSPLPDEDVVFCTQDALECPDGTFVGRVGPKCEFAPCPEGLLD